MTLGFKVFLFKKVPRWNANLFRLPALTHILLRKGVFRTTGPPSCFSAGDSAEHQKFLHAEQRSLLHHFPLHQFAQGL